MLLRYLLLLILAFILYRFIRSLLKELTGGTGTQRWHSASHRTDSSGRKSDIKDIKDADFEEIDEKEEKRDRS